MAYRQLVRVLHILRTQDRQVYRQRQRNVELTVCHFLLFFCSAGNMHEVIVVRSLLVGVCIVVESWLVLVMCLVSVFLNLRC